MFSQIDKNNHVPRKILCNFLLWMERTFWGGRGVGCGVNTNKQTHIILWNQNDFEFLNSNIGSLKTVEQSFQNNERKLFLPKILYPMKILVKWKINIRVISDMQDLKHLYSHTLFWEVTGGCSLSKKGINQVNHKRKMWESVNRRSNGEQSKTIPG